jgi:hypothetical protein
MLICNGDLAYECSTITTDTVGTTQCVEFDIFASVSPDDVRVLLAGDTFYFFDEILNGRLPVTNNTKLVGLRIDYNADSTRKILIILTQKGVVDDES